MYVRTNGIGRLRNKSARVQMDGLGQASPMSAVGKASPYLGVSAMMFIGQSLLPGEPTWARITRTGMLAAGTVAGGWGLLEGLKELGRVLAWEGKIPPPEPELLEQVSPLDVSVILDSLQAKTGGLTRSQWADQPFEFAVKNETDRPIAFYVGLDIRKDDGSSAFRTPVLERRAVRLAPRQSEPLMLTAPAEGGFPKLAWMDVRYVFVQVFKKRDDPEPVKQSDPLTIDMWLYG